MAHIVMTLGPPCQIGLGQTLSGDRDLKDHRERHGHEGFSQATDREVRLCFVCYLKAMASRKCAINNESVL